MNEPNQPPPLPPPLPGPDPRPVVPLEYGGRPALITTQQAGSAVVRFLAGLGTGAAISLVFWGLGWHAFVANKFDSGISALFLVPGGKLVVATVCMFFRGWRAFGAGLLVSIGLGVMIFFGSCLYHA